MNSKEFKMLGLKATLPRLKILELFEQSEKQHLSAEDVYKDLLLHGEEFGLATVYRVLTQFVNANLLSRHNFEDGHSIFELNNGPHHDHLVCDQCGKIVEFVDESIEASQQKVAKEFAFKMTDHSLQIFGICPDCRNNDK